MIGAIAAHYVASGGGGGGGYSGAVLADSPLGYWRLGEASGTTMLDSSGNSRDGTYYGSPTLGVTGLVSGDTCADFDGSTQYAVVPWGAWMNVTTAITLEAWVSLDTTGTYQSIIDRDNEGSSRIFQFRTTNVNTFQLLLWTSAGIQVATGTTTLATGTAYHLASTYDGSNIRLYINGALELTTAASGTISTSGVMDFHVARHPTGVQYVNGRVDEAAFYGSALSGTRIAAHYAAR